MARITEDQIKESLVTRIKDAALGRKTDDVKVHTLPQSPADVPDTPELRFVIAGPEYATVPGEDVSPELREFFQRTYRNNVILLAPENALLSGLRQRIHRILGWQSIIESEDEMSLLSEQQPSLPTGT